MPSAPDRADLSRSDPLIDSYELARRLGVSHATVKRWRFERSGPPPVRLGTRLVRYRPADVDRFVRSRARR